MSHFLHGGGSGRSARGAWTLAGPRYFATIAPIPPLYLHWPPLNNIIAGKQGGMGGRQLQNFTNRWTRAVKHDASVEKVQGEGGCWVD